jgi:CBS domain-containing protein
MADDKPPYEEMLRRAAAGERPVGVQGAPIESAETPITTLITRDVVTVAPDTPLTEVVALFGEQGISHLPVVDPDGRLVGIVTKTDVVQELGEPSPPKPRLRKDALVSELMQRQVLTVTEDTTIARASELMAHYRVHALPVVVHKDRLVGLLTSLDVLGWVGGVN